jgi:hypothetical protein
MVVTSKDVPRRGRPATEVLGDMGEKPEEPPKKQKMTKKEIVANLTVGKILLRMVSDNYSYETAEGVTFLREHPFQFVSEGEAEMLLYTMQFKKASPEEMAEYYKK